MAISLAATLGAFCSLQTFLTTRDRDLDIIYIVRTLRLKEQTPLQHAEAVRSWKLHWAWPRDGKRETLEGAGIPLMEQYRDAGLDMMFNFAQFEDGTVSVEAGLMEMVSRMRGGRLKVFKGQNDAWLEEYRLYHRDGDGRVVKENDDAISASRYGIMMRRFGRAGDWDFHRPINYPKLKLV